MAGPRRFHAALHQTREINVNVLRFARPRYACLKHLLYGIGEAVRIFDHQPIKITALGYIDLPALQCLQVESDRRNGSFEFVSYRVDETIVLLVLADFAQQKTSIEDEPGHDGPEKDNPKEQFRSFAPIHDGPAEADGHRHGREDNSE